MGCKTVIKWPKQITAGLVEQLIKAEKDIQKAILIFDAATAEYTNGFRHDNGTFGIIISRLLSANWFKPAEDMLARMKEENCMITEDVFLSMYRAYGRVHKPLDVVRIFQMMKDYDCEPTQKSYITVFSILVNENRLKTAFKFYRYMREKGKLREALEIFDKIKLQGLQPDAGLYWKIISLFCEINKFQEAANYLDEMVLSGVLPNRVTWGLHVKIHNTVVQGLCVGNDPNRAFQLYLSIRTRGISVEAETFKLLVDHFCKKGDLHKSARIVEEMVIDGCIPGTGTWTAVLDAFWDRRKAKEATELAFSELMAKLMECKTPSLVEH
nr:hypothetical protein COLO4_31418 [Ipomoea trifida]